MPLDSSIEKHLKAIIDKRGKVIITNAGMAKSLLADFCGDSLELERNLLIAAIQHGIARELYEIPYSTIDIMTAQRLARIIESKQGVVEHYAQWVVVTWAKALGKSVPQSILDNLQQSGPNTRQASASQGQAPNSSNVATHTSVFQGTNGPPTQEQSASPNFQPPLPNQPEKANSFIYWLLVVAICLGIVAVGQNWNAPSSPAPATASTSTSMPVSTSEKTIDPPTSQSQPVRYEQEMRAFAGYVAVKDQINSDIVSLAGQINDYINRNGDLRNSGNLKRQAQDMQNAVQAVQSKFAREAYPAPFNQAQAMLSQLFALEVKRIQSLYNGLIEGGNGQDYHSSFGVGTKASFEFDDLDKNFVSAYGALQSQFR